MTCQVMASVQGTCKSGALQFVVELRPLRLLPFLPALALALAMPASTAALPQAGVKLDHILLWGRSLDEVTAIMAVKLGFQVKPGRDPAGLANRYIRFADQGFIELLGITRPNPELDPGSAADQAALHGAAGARSFGIHSSALDQARTALEQGGFGVTPIFTAAANDPDGGGPGAPPRWRLFAFGPQPLSSSSFLIDYAPPKSDPASRADDMIARTHPNGARTLSAFWLLSSDADKDRQQLARMGFASATPVSLPEIAARGFCVKIGPSSLLALQPDGAGIAADALRSGGPQILGVSVGVADLDHAQRLVERGYDRTLTRYRGLLGTSVLAPSRDDLGLLVEFHDMPQAKDAGACGAAS